MKIVFLLLLLIALGVHGWRCSTHEANEWVRRRPNPTPPLSRSAVDEPLTEKGFPGDANEGEINPDFRGDLNNPYGPYSNYGGQYGNY
ncbi:unnamed protein product [Caenorhabditis auriculariae]|uniref:Secreted protein n=1 Tax=Caenorhabditis auriculariae TaxID=2777116 RepID=A0A8S1H3H3_9PELO|nr:unnamed protein product [Caenorhabditis auriculariae]